MNRNAMLRAKRRRLGGTDGNVPDGPLRRMRRHYVIARQFHQASARNNETPLQRAHIVVMKRLISFM